jgi:hypothetical protein
MTLGAWRRWDERPTTDQVATRMSHDRRPLWMALTGWLRESYGLEGEPAWTDEEEGWVFRYRLSGRALTTLSPTAEGGFGALVVLGPSLWAAAEAAQLSDATREIMGDATAYADGRWLWLRVHDRATLEDVETLIAIKAPPRRRIVRRVVLARGEPVSAR